jgi:hypothetical protein
MKSQKNGKDAALIRAQVQDGIEALFLPSGQSYALSCFGVETNKATAVTGDSSFSHACQVTVHVPQTMHIERDGNVVQKVTLLLVKTRTREENPWRPFRATVRFKGDVRIDYENDLTRTGPCWGRNIGHTPGFTEAYSLGSTGEADDEF